MGDDGEIPFYLFPSSYISNMVPFSTLEHFFFHLIIESKTLTPKTKYADAPNQKKIKNYCTFLVLQMHLTLRKVLPLKPSQATSTLPLFKDLLWS